jgi:hypothetical protein
VNDQRIISRFHTHFLQIAKPFTPEFFTGSQVFYMIGSGWLTLGRHHYYCHHYYEQNFH